MLTDILAGIIIAVLAGLGVGGGGLLVLYLVFFRGTPQLEAQGLNLIFFIFASGASLLYHIKKRKINTKLTLLLAAAGAFGAICGAYLANAISPVTIRKCFGYMLIISGIIALFRKN